MSSDSDNSHDSANTAVQRNERERVSTAPNHDAVSELFRVGVRIPPFWPERPHIWFTQIESQFSLSRITDDNTKFHYVLSHLERQYILEVEDIITSPPTSGKYEKLKTELIRRLSVSRDRKVKQLLESEEMGDRKPTQFLRHLQHLAGVAVPEDFLRSIWMSRLPINLQSIVAAHRNSLPLGELAELADSVHDIAPTSPQVAAATTSKTDSAMEIMARQITELTKQVSALTAKIDNRSRSRTRSTGHQQHRTPSRRSQSNYRKFPTCWYHNKFGQNATKCHRPCDFKSGKDMGSL